MDNKQLIIIVAAILVAGCIVAGAVLFASSDGESMNGTVVNNTTNVTNSSLVNNTTSEVVSDGSGQSSQSNNHAQSSSDIQVDPASENYATLQGYDSAGNKYYMYNGEWKDQYFMDHYAVPG